MFLRRVSCAFMMCAVLAGGMAMDIAVAAPQEPEVETVVGRSSAHFSMDVPAGSLCIGETGFSLRAGEGITIQAIYFPASANVDVGFIAPDGLFYSVKAAGGSIDRTIRVSQRGFYTIAVRNNSSEEISVSGYVSC